MPLPPPGTLRRARGVTAVPTAAGTPGIRVGHWQSQAALTGVSVIVPPPGTCAGVDVRGGGPASRETAILAPGTLEYGADAVVLTGGSAFGLAAASGVQDALAAADIGCPAGEGLRVPIVPAAAIFDLGRAAGSPQPPAAQAGAAAFAAARADDARRGSVGAGTGAWTGRGISRGGLGQASVTTALGHTVAAIVVANPMGSVLAADGRLHAAGTLAAYGIDLPAVDPAVVASLHTGTEQPAGPRNTTIACIVTDAQLSDAQATRLAASAHAGIARAIRPSHTLFDGDTVFALAIGARPLEAGDEAGLDLALLNIAAADALSAAIVDAVLSAGAYVDDAGQACQPPRHDSPAPMSAHFPALAQAWAAVE